MAFNCQDVESLFERIFTSAGYDLSVKANSKLDDCVVEFVGSDAALFISSGGELLEAIEHIGNRVYARSLPAGGRICCDANGYRAARQSELRAMARHASEQVSRTRQAFMFAPMPANERRIIHEALAENQSVTTESVDEGNTRRLRVLPRD